MNAERERHHAAVGRVAVAWTRVENELASTVQMLACLNTAVGTCLTAQIGNSARMIDAMWSLCELRSPGITKGKEFRKRTEKIMSLGERRNRVVHDVWLFDPGLQTREETTAKRSLKSELKIMPTDEVNALGADIENALEEFVSFWYHMLNDMGIWPGNPRDKPTP